MCVPCCTSEIERFLFSRTLGNRRNEHCFRRSDPCPRIGARYCVLRLVLNVQWLWIAAKNIPELNTLFFGNSNYLRVFSILNCSSCIILLIFIDYNDNYLEIHADHCSVFEHHIHYHDVLSISNSSLLNLIHICKKKLNWLLKSKNLIQNSQQLKCYKERKII